MHLPVVLLVALLMFTLPWPAELKFLVFCTVPAAREYGAQCTGGAEPGAGRDGGSRRPGSSTERLPRLRQSWRLVVRLSNSADYPRDSRCAGAAPLRP